MRSLAVMASAAAFSLVLTAVHRRNPIAGRTRSSCDAAAETGRMTYAAGSNTLYVCDGSAWQAH
ncbi:MAG TPA: hypothetical protein VFL61_07725 [Gaiellaceae bacterium]|nr:hypothetical protein [Gaiellaceae bacterium]